MENTDKKIVTRFAPSPTGLPHIGNIRTALFNYIFTKQTKGKMILRIEDTDKERSKPEYEENILDCLKWLGLGFDEFYRQSERADIHKKYLEDLIKKDLAYISKEAVTEPGQRAEVIRFRNPGKKVTFKDLIRGDIEFDTTELGDFVIAKSVDEPIFHLAVVVDDFEMGVTHVIRGEDHISNTPRQILIQEAIGAPRPIYAHLPLIMAPDRSKLSKRKHGEITSVMFYKKEGFLRDALVNFLALLGWNPGGNDEMFSLDQIIEKFDFKRIQKGGAIFNTEKLLWLNKEYIKKLDREDLNSYVLKSLSNTNIYKKVSELSKEKMDSFSSLVMDRVNIFSEITKFAENSEYDFYFEMLPITKEAILNNGKFDQSKTVERLEKAKEFFEKIEENNFKIDVIKNSIWDYATTEGRGEVLWPLRFALTGKDKSPDPFSVANFLGREETLRRIENGIDKLK